MSCYNNCYLPNPPRAWSRVQNSCSLNTDDSTSGVVQLPYSNKIIPVASLGLELAMLNKGNVLQYKANSSNLTKAQKYSKIVQGQWVNRNTTWATQSTRGYTNPNTTSLKRSGNVVNIAIDPITGAVIGPTAAAPTCPQSVIPNNGGLPSNGGGGSDVDDPNIPPPVEPTEGSNTFPDTIPDTPVEPIVIQDGGVLICSVQENICTGETKSTVSQQLCNPTTDSDVPGTIQELCWNDGTPTWYPRSRYIMTNSANKWPVNATLDSAVKPLPPVITSVTNNCTIVTLTWTQDETCLLVSRFDIYQNGVFVKSVAGTVFTTEVDVNNLTISTYNFFIIAGTSGNVVSNPSNSVSISIVVYPPTNLTNGIPQLISITSITEGLATVQISWSPSSLNLCDDTGYNIYQDNTLVATVPFSVTSYTVTLLTSQSYNFNVTSVFGGIESVLSSTLVVTLPAIYTTTGLPAHTYSSGSIMLKYSAAGTFNFNYVLSMEYTLVGGGSGGGYWFFDVGTSAGGGGQVLNTDGSRNVSANNWTIVVGQGSLAATYTINAVVGTDSSIAGTGFYVATTNTTYAGQGGLGRSNYSTPGGGGPGGGITSASGGTYTVYANSSGPGGGGGSLTLVDPTNTIISLDTIGGPGLNNQSNASGNGGSGHLGIDGITYYGGGGGGGGWPGANPLYTPGTGYPGGTGGSGGGGNGASNVVSPPSRDGTPAGGGGGGGSHNNTDPLLGIFPGNGSNGIVILLFKAPP